MFDTTPKKVRGRMNQQNLNFTALVMEEIEEEAQSPKRSNSLNLSRAGGKRKMPDLEELTNPFIL